MRREVISIQKVERLTKMLIITNDGGRWSRSTGYRSPSEGAWALTHIMISTDEHRITIKRKVFGRRLFNVKVEKLTDDQMDSITAILDS